jgi:hypothetical protein
LLDGSNTSSEGNLPNSLVENALKVPLSQSGALKVLVCLDFLGASQRLFVRHGLHTLLAEGLERSGVFSKIELGSDQDDGDIGRMMVDLGVPLELVSTGLGFLFAASMVVSSYLGLDVVKRGGADDGEADEENVGLGVGQRSQSVVIFLTSGIPETQANGLAIHHHARRVVIEAASHVASAMMFRMLSAGKAGTNTVGMYSPGKAFVVYEMSRQVLMESQ